MITRAKPRWTAILVAVLTLLPLGVAMASSSGTWTVATSMSAAREQHAAIGAGVNVLIAGGITCNTSPCTALSSSEVYNAVANTWQPTRSMTTPRFGQTMTLLTTGPLSGTILTTGGCATAADGVHCSNVLSSAEIFSPKTGTWKAVGSMLTSRFAHTATQLANGNVLIAGGYNTANSLGLTSAELFNAATQTFTTTGSMANRRDFHTATLLNNGFVLVAGGCCINGASTSSAEVYNPGTGLWSATGSMQASRYNHTATLLKTGQVLVTGGLSGCADYVCAPTSSAELFSPSTGTWAFTGSMSTPRYLQTATLINAGPSAGRVLVAGGASAYGGSPLSSAEIFNSSTGVFSVTGSLNFARVSHTASALGNGQIVVTGGYNFASGTNTLKSVEIYHP